MIGRLRGNVAHKDLTSVVIDVQGVGYEVEVPTSTLSQVPAVGASIELYTHLVVREDAHLLFGFISLHDRNAFRLLLKISGVGPKLALAILSAMGVSELAGVVASQNTSRLTQISGVGKKTAERLLLELRDKFKDAAATLPQGQGAPSATSDIINTLLALGYNEREVQHAMRTVSAELSVEEAVRQALRTLSRID